MLRCAAAIVLLIAASSGCALIPDVTHEPQFHNPFPQFYRVAILPFNNQSGEPTVDGLAVAEAYYNELQAVRGFEVMPVRVARTIVEGSGFEPRSSEDFQKLARMLGVDVVVVGSITEFTPYYPPRMGLAVNWYAANPAFHPVPAGYGLPWGTPHEEEIPEEIVFQAELALAREQLATQTPEPDLHADGVAPISHQDSQTKEQPFPVTKAEASASSAMPARLEELLPAPGMHAPEAVEAPPRELPLPPAASGSPAMSPGSVSPELPPAWPDPRGFIPPPPTLTPPPALPQREPVMTHTRVYHGNDADFTSKLEKYYYYRDDARFGGWQSYLQRSDDFTRFCCHLHITEMLAARGGAGKPKVVYRWPISRYER